MFRTTKNLRNYWIQMWH